jgi:hypothetical protein
MGHASEPVGHSPDTVALLCNSTRSFGVLLWVILRCLPPWVKKDNGFARNKLLGKYPPGTPDPYVTLTARCVCVWISLLISTS